MPKGYLLRLLLNHDKVKKKVKKVEFFLPFLLPKQSIKPLTVDLLLPSVMGNAGLWQYRVRLY